MTWKGIKASLEDWWDMGRWSKGMGLQEAQRHSSRPFCFVSTQGLFRIDCAIFYAGDRTSFLTYTVQGFKLDYAVGDSALI